MIKKCKVLLCLILIFTSCFAIFSIKNEFSYKTLNDNKVSIYFNNEKKDNIPSKNEAIFSKSICDDDVSVSWDNDSWGLLISNLSKKVKCNLYFYSGPTEFDFDYTGAEQFFTAPITGNYKVELWGASGGSYDEEYHGGYGGYTSGIINLAENQTLYIYVGASNICKEGTTGYTDIAFNGGGRSGDYSWEERYFCGGGGATDVRLYNGIWNNFNSLKSRIMVAGGGGGADWYTSYYSAVGGSAGGLESYIGYKNQAAEVVLNSSSQKSGHLFGIGKDSATNGGGGGYYGGNAANWTGGAGGSSFISGHNGCDAIKKESTEDNIIHTGQSIHYSGLYFTNTVMIDGNGYNWTSEKGDCIGMPSHDESTKMVGNLGNGYAKITLLVD